MFVNLRFSMVNSMGAKVSVVLSVCGDHVEYELSFPSTYRARSRRGSLGPRVSERILENLCGKGIVELLFKFVAYGLDSTGDYWRLSIDMADGRSLELSGDEDSCSVLDAIVQDIAEILDNQFKVTRFIRSTRLDKLEVCFINDELSPELRESLTDFENCDHMEALYIDRAHRGIMFYRRFPSSCFRVVFECICDEEVRNFLDQTEELFDEPRLFEDVDRVVGCPDIAFRFTYHDGSSTMVTRPLSLEGLKDMEYVEMLDVLFELLLHVVFKQGMFDKRFLFPREVMEKTPFFVAYSEDDEELMEPAE